jgi:lysozyme
VEGQTTQPIEILSGLFVLRINLMLLSTELQRAIAPLAAWVVLTTAPVQAENTQTATLREITPTQEFVQKIPLYDKTPERIALLRTIRYAEGTWKNGAEEGYRTLYGGSLFTDTRRHPDIVVRARYASAAAGAYQFMPDTWEGAARYLNLPDFGPESQDQGALYLVEKRGVLDDVDRGEFSQQVVARLAPEWASFPTLGGGSYYGQPSVRYEELRDFYYLQLSTLRFSDALTRNISQEGKTLVQLSESNDPRSSAGVSPVQ